MDNEQGIKRGFYNFIKKGKEKISNVIYFNIIIINGNNDRFVYNQYLNQFFEL